MPQHESLDDEILAVVRSQEFIACAKDFLKSDNRYSNLRVRTATNLQLKRIAKAFCSESLHKFFPGIEADDVPNCRLIYKEVVCHYRNSKTRLVNKSELKRQLGTACPAKSTSLSSRRGVTSRTALAHSKALNDSTLKKCRTQRLHRKVRSKIDEFAVRKSSNDTRTPIQPDIRTWLEPVAQGEGKRTLRKTISSQVSVEQHHRQKEVLPQHPTHVEISTSNQLPLDLAELEATNRQMKAKIERLEAEKEKSVAYRTFIDSTLRLCYQAHLEEAICAKDLGLHDLATSRDAVVKVMKDLQSDFDLKYFGSYYQYHGCAPPVRYWLESWMRLQ